MSRSIFVNTTVKSLHFFVIVCLSLTLLFGEQKKPEWFATARYYVSFLVHPAQWIADLPVASYHRFQYFFQSHKRLRERHARLEAENLILSGELQQLAMLAAENRQLRALLGAPKQAGNTKRAAKIVSISLEPNRDIVMINKGRRDGIQTGDAVLDANGLMGQVVETMPLGSRVLLISDIKQGVPVQIARNQVRAILQGTGDETRLNLTHVPHSEDVVVGDLLVTSGLAKRYPMGLPVARVTAVSHIAGSHFATVTAKPVAKLNQSRDVLLLSHQLTSEFLQTSEDSSASAESDQEL